MMIESDEAVWSGNYADLQMEEARLVNDIVRSWL